jgi:hypothetical protein
MPLNKGGKCTANASVSNSILGFSRKSAHLTLFCSSGSALLGSSSSSGGSNNTARQRTHERLKDKA